MLLGWLIGEFKCPKWEVSWNLDRKWLVPNGTVVFLEMEGDLPLKCPSVLLVVTESGKEADTSAFRVLISSGGVTQFE